MLDSQTIADGMLSLSRNCSLVLLVAYFLAQASNTSALNLTDVDIECLMLKGLDACYSAAYTSQTRDQQCFTISEVAASRLKTHHRPNQPH